MFLLVEVLFEVEAGSLKFTQRDDRRSCKVRISVNERAVGRYTETQCSKTGLIMHAQQKIPLC
jgi:hypothetical protein